MAYTIDTSKVTVPEALELLADAVVNPKFQSWEVAEQVRHRRGPPTWAAAAAAAAAVRQSSSRGQRAAGRRREGEGGSPAEAAVNRQRLQSTSD